MITENLRNATKPAHAELDQGLYSFLQQLKSIDGYAALLCTFYGFFAPVQQDIDRFINEAQLTGHAQRRKPQWIITDLETIGMNPPSIQRCDKLPGVQNRYQAWGCYYVLEGSTMGGSIISRLLNKNVPGIDRALGFFKGYGDDNLRMWKIFLESMENVEDNAMHQQEIISAANDTFKYFKKWIIQQYAATT